MMRCYLIYHIAVMVSLLECAVIRFYISASGFGLKPCCWTTSWRKSSKMIRFGRKMAEYDEPSWEPLFVLWEDDQMRLWRVVSEANKNVHILGQRTEWGPNLLMERLLCLGLDIVTTWMPLQQVRTCWTSLAPTMARCLVAMSCTQFRSCIQDMKETACEYLQRHLDLLVLKVTQCDVMRKQYIPKEAIWQFLISWIGSTSEVLEKKRLYDLKMNLCCWYAAKSLGERRRNFVWKPGTPETTCWKSRRVIWQREVASLQKKAVAPTRPLQSQASPGAQGGIGQHEAYSSGGH